MVTGGLLERLNGYGFGCDVGDGAIDAGTVPHHECETRRRRGRPGFRAMMKLRKGKATALQEEEKRGNTEA